MIREQPSIAKRTLLSSEKSPNATSVAPRAFAWFTASFLRMKARTLILRFAKADMTREPVLPNAPVTRIGLFGSKRLIALELSTNLCLSIYSYNYIFIVNIKFKSAIKD